MSDQDKKRFYWLKLQKDFFKRHDIRIIENLPNGKDYIIFYLKLLCESTSHAGLLRFSDEIPYDDNMLATITDTNIDTVRSAIKTFTSLKMIEVLDDGTLYMRQVEKMIGSETGKAQRMREDRERQSATLLPHCSPEIEIDIEKESEIDKEKKKKKKRKDAPDQTEYDDSVNIKEDLGELESFLKARS